MHASRMAGQSPQPTSAQLQQQSVLHACAGVTQRRWLAFCNPPLRTLITSKLGGEEWIKDLFLLTVRAGHKQAASW